MDDLILNHFTAFSHRLLLQSSTRPYLSSLVVASFNQLDLSNNFKHLAASKPTFFNVIIEIF